MFSMAFVLRIARSTTNAYLIPYIIHSFEHHHFNPLRDLINSDIFSYTDVIVLVSFCHCRKRVLVINSEEEPEAFEATANMSMAPSPDPQPGTNSPNRDPAGDDWLIGEPPTVAANIQKRLTGAASGRRSLRRPRSVGGGYTLDARPVSSAVPLFGTQTTREMEGACYSAPPVNPSSEGEREAGLRTSSARTSTVAFVVQGKDVASPPGPSTGVRQHLPREEQGENRRVVNERRVEEAKGEHRSTIDERKVEEAKGDSRNVGERKIYSDDDQRRNTALDENVDPATAEMGVSRDGGPTVGKYDQSIGRAVDPYMARTKPQEEEEEEHQEPVDCQDTVLEPGDTSKRAGIPAAVVAVARHDVPGNHELAQLDTGQASSDSLTTKPHDARTVGGNPGISIPGSDGDGGVAMAAVDIATSLATLPRDHQALYRTRDIADAAGRGLELTSSFSLPLENTHDVGDDAARTPVSPDTETRPAGGSPQVGHCAASGGNVVDFSVGAGPEPTLTSGPTHADSKVGFSVIDRPASPSLIVSPGQSLRDDDDDGGDDVDDDDDGGDEELGGSASKTLRPASSSPTASLDNKGKSTLGSQLTPLLGGGDQQPQGSRPVLEENARSTAPRRTTLSSSAASSGSHAESSVGFQSTSSSREGDTSAARTTPGGSAISAEVGMETSPDERSSRAGTSSVTEESSAAGERSSLRGRVLDGDGGGIDTADKDDDDDGYF